MPYGTLSTFDTLAASQQTVADFGEDNAWEAIGDLLDAHNEIMREEVSTLVEFTTDNLRRFGGAPTMEMDEVDEYGRADAQKLSTGVNVGFPLRLQQLPVQWTRRYFLNKTASEFAAQFLGVLDAHRRRVSRDIKRAFFIPTNNLTYIDRLVANVTLPLRALINADSTEIPPGPNGESFDGATHTHYLARAGGSLAASDITALLETVREHYSQGAQYLYINRAQEAAVRAFGNFAPYPVINVILPDNTLRGDGNLDETNLYNRAIGVWDSGAEVWVKPWVPASYMLTYLTEVRKPLALRERRPGSSNLVVAAEDEQYPLRAKFNEAEYGVGVQERTNGAVLYTGNTTYAAPTITS